MKRSRFSALLIACLVLSLVTVQGIAQDEPPEELNSEPSAVLSNPLWTIGWADRTTSTNVGTDASVAFNPANNLPYISYYDAVNGNLMLTSPVAVSGTGNCGTGNNWWCRAVDTTGDVGKYSSIEFYQISADNWKLGIAYYDATNHGLKYAVWTQSGGSGSWAIDLIVHDADHIGLVGTYPSLKFTTSGTPFIAYHNAMGSNGWLYLALFVGSGGNCGENSWLNKWNCKLVDAGPAMGQYPSLAIGWNDGEHIAYYDGGNGNLKYATWVGVGGNCASASYRCVIIDGSVVGVDAGLYPSILTYPNPGVPTQIAYYDKTNGKLRYAYTTQSGANCGNGGWWCGDVDSIGAGIVSPVGISIDLDRNNRTIIAYMNASTVGPATLKIARPAGATGILIGNCGDIPPGYLFNYWQCETLDSAGYGGDNVDVAAYTAIDVSNRGQIIIPYLEEDSYYSTTSLKFAQTNPTFTDVPFAHWAHNWIDDFYEAGITTGCGVSPLNYCPDRRVTRAEMAVFILRAKNGLGTPAPSQSNMFSDVPVTGKEWMKPWIEEFYMEGITSGCYATPSLQYCPEREVTRAEMAVFVLRAIHGAAYVPPQTDPGVFADVPAAGKTWMEPWIVQFYNEGITTGCAQDPLRYCPEQAVTRAEMAVFLDRAFDIP